MKNYKGNYNKSLKSHEEFLNMKIKLDLWANNSKELMELLKGKITKLELLEEKSNKLNKISDCQTLNKIN